VAVGEKVVSEERRVDQRLDDAAHEAGVAQVDLQFYFIEFHYYYYYQQFSIFF
jgi:hypothetical protein